MIQQIFLPFEQFVFTERILDYQSDNIRPNCYE